MSKRRSPKAGRQRRQRRLQMQVRSARQVKTRIKHARTRQRPQGYSTKTKRGKGKRGGKSGGGAVGGGERGRRLQIQISILLIRYKCIPILR